MTKKNEIAIYEILQAQFSQLQILQNDKELINNQRIQPGTRVSFCVFPKPSQNFGYIAPGDVNLTGMSTIEGAMPVVQGIPLTIEVEWEIKDAQGNLAIEGVDYLAPNGKKGVEISIIFIPRKFVELTSDSSAVKYQLPTAYSLQANIVIKAGNGMGNSVVGNKEISLSVSPLAIPIIFAAYTNPNFTLYSELSNDYSEMEGALLLFTPENSIIRNTENLFSIISELRDLTSTLISLPDFFLLNSGLCLLYNTILSQNHIQFRNRTSINLRSIFFPDTGENWANKISSLMLIGPPNCSVTCTNNIEDLREGEFTITTEPLKSTCYALIRILDNKIPISEPNTTCVKVHKEPPSGQTFDNSISFLKINPLPVTPVVI
ncbi:MULTISPECIES: hypothetical protein [Bacillus cereus group]|uniref:hypothetical protein n=1 Tax=Bacillus cereus group TaxID=86661 RepID=UPI000B601562|nr:MULTISPECIES: hypothetical protein [Bacillus cereus group]ASL62655.1 hypothetical protein FORC47_p303 [Bacillus cereus]PGN34892.1 hypothetical protein CN968_26125 [Bacillus thuringiensis]